MSKSSISIWLGSAMVLYYGIIRGVNAVKVIFDKFRIVGSTANGLLCRISLLVRNPLLVDVTVNDINGNVYIMDTHVATIDYPVNQRIRAFGTSMFDIGFEAYTDKLGDAILQNIQTGDPHTLIIRFDGYIGIRKVKIPVSKQFTYDEIMQ